MSSFTRRIQRTVSPSRKVHPVLDRKGDPIPGEFYANPARNKHFGGRGSKLGVNNPRDKALAARRRRDAKWGRASV